MPQGDPERTGPARRIAQLERINTALIQRLDRLDEVRGSAHAMFQAAAALEKEIKARNRELEVTLADLSRKNAELARARGAAEEANRSKTRFLRAASHDLLQPLSAAKLFLAMLSDSPLTEAQGDIVRRLGAAFTSVEDLMHAVLDIARLDSARIEFNRKTVCLAEVFARLEAEFQHMAQDRGLTLRFAATSVCVDSDPTFLFRIAQNLVSNAIKYTEVGGVLVGVRRAGQRVWLEVRDTGTGIPAEDRNRIFDEFQRLRPDQQRAPGMGLGLSIVRRACLKLGHPITLESEPGRGSVFRIGLPLVDGRGRPGTAAVAAPTGSEALVGRSVIVIENDPGMAEAYRLTLGEKYGMAVTMAASTDETLARSDCEPAVIVADFHLEGEDTGLHAIAALREALGVALPALLVTANRDPAMLRDCQRMGVQVLEKPVRPEDLRDALQGLLGSRAR